MATYTLKEFSHTVKINNQYVSYKTVERMAIYGLLPSWCKVKKLAGKTGARLIEVEGVSPAITSPLK